MSASAIVQVNCANEQQHQHQQQAWIANFMAECARTKAATKAEQEAEERR